jgi:hypothetical protein
MGDIMMKTRLVLCLVMLLAIGTFAYGAIKKAPGGIEFTYYDPVAYSVSLAGTFNNWDPNSDPMTEDGEGTWRVVVPLSPGKHEYKFVINGSDWMADPENPKVVGAYGNSGVEIDSQGEPVIGDLVERISNTAANARVMLNGWFRGTYTTRRDGLGDPRWRLSRPAHEMYVSVNPTIGPDVRGSTTMLIDSGVGDVREVSADLYSGWLAYKSRHFDLTAYHNEEIVSFDDPMEAIGHIDLPGTVGEEHVDFGRGTQGVIADFRFGGLGLRTLYSNTYDDDIYNSDVRFDYDFGQAKFDSVTRYDNTGTDILALRASTRVRALAVGFTFVSERNGWWIGVDNAPNQPDRYITEYRDVSGDDRSDWFEIGTRDQLIGGDISIAPEGWLTLTGEFAKASYQAKWDAGNQVRKHGTQLVDGEIDVMIGDEDGDRYKVGLAISRDVHTLNLTYEDRDYGGMMADEAYFSSHALPFEDPDASLINLYGPTVAMDSSYVRKYENINSIDQFVLYEHDPLPARHNQLLEVDLATRLLMLDFALAVDIAKMEWDYAGFTRKDSDLTRVSVVPEVGVSLFGDRLRSRLMYQSSKDNLSGRMPSPYDKSELEFTDDLEIGDTWRLYFNWRRARYEWTEDDNEHNESFVNTHVALIWSPVPRVEVRIGYGLNPLYYRDTPVEGRQIGRERYVSSHIWRDPTLRLVDGERALDDLKIITLMGVISF